jgi:hypothetical protein
LSFFGQALCDLETLRTYQFFLLNYGQGYTGDFIGQMDFDALNWHVTKLHEKLTAEQKAREQAARKAKAGGRRR